MEDVDVLVGGLGLWEIVEYWYLHLQQEGLLAASNGNRIRITNQREWKISCWIIQDAPDPGIIIRTTVCTDRTAPKIVLLLLYLRQTTDPTLLYKK